MFHCKLLKNYNEIMKPSTTADNDRSQNISFFQLAGLESTQEKEVKEVKGDPFICFKWSSSDMLAPRLKKQVTSDKYLVVQKRGSFSTIIFEITVFFSYFCIWYWWMAFGWCRPDRSMLTYWNLVCMLMWRVS